MKKIILFIVCLAPNLLFAQSIDSLEAQILEAKKTVNRLNNKIDSLNNKKEAIEIKIEKLSRVLSKNKFKIQSKNGISSTIGFMGGKLKESPSPKANTLYEMKDGEKVLLYGMVNGDYFKASYNGSIGYIHRIYLDKSKYVKSAISSRKKAKFEGLAKEKPELARLIKTYGREIAEKLVNGQIWIGMSKSMVSESLGSPSDINNTVTSYGTSSQWIYKGRKYLYFEDGKLTSWQNW